MLNRLSSIIEDAIDSVPQIECNVLLDEFPIATETRKAVQPLSSGKAPNANVMPVEVYKGATDDRETDRVVSLYVEPIPQEFKDDSISHPYKQYNTMQYNEFNHT